MMKKVTQLQTQNIIEYKIHILKVRQISFLQLACSPNKNSGSTLCKKCKKQARKSSEDAQATEYAQFKKVWAG